MRMSNPSGIKMTIFNPELDLLLYNACGKCNEQKVEISTDLEYS